MPFAGQAEIATASGSAFVADLHDCLLDLAAPGAPILALALDPCGEAIVQAALGWVEGLSALGLSVRRPPAVLPWLVGVAARLPLRSASLAAILLCGGLDDQAATRRVLDEAQRVLRSGAALLVANPTACPAPRLRRAGHAVAWCRLLEEHGFTVEKTLATRTALPVEAGALRDRTGRAIVPTVVQAPGMTRDRALARHAWESLIVQARAC